jgi:hypothetical protein
MNNFVLAEPLGSDLVMADAAYEGIRLCHAFSGSALQSSWSPPAVTLQKRSVRAEVMNFLRNAPVVSAKAVAQLSPLIGNVVEFLPLASKSDQPELFVVNALVVLTELPDSDDVPVFRLLGQTRDTVYFSETFKSRAEAIGGPGVRFVAASQRYPRRQVPFGGITGGFSFIECDRLATPSRIAEAEARTGLRFPDSLRWLFAHANGGRPADAASPISSFATLRDGRGSAEWTYERLVTHFGLVPWTWFPFGDDAGGDVFFVDCSTRDGTAYLWQHDTNDERIVPVTTTLADFVASIRTTDA